MADVRSSYVRAGNSLPASNDLGKGAGTSHTEAVGGCSSRFLDIPKVRRCNFYNSSYSHSCPPSLVQHLMSLFHVHRSPKLLGLHIPESTSAVGIHKQQIVASKTN